VEIAPNEPDLLLRLAERRVEQRRVLRLLLAARKCELAAVYSALAAHDEHQPELAFVVSENRNENGRRRPRHDRGGGARSPGIDVARTVR
jgi:hypothetical protein